MEKTLCVKNRVVRKSGNAYHIIIPTAIVEQTESLDQGKTYKIYFEEERPHLSYNSYIDSSRMEAVV